MVILKRGFWAVALVLALGGVGGASWAVPATQTGATAVNGTALDEFVQGSAAEAGVPGAAYAVVGPQGIVHQASFGTDGDGRAVSDSTPFLWGSVSKPVTATLVVLLAGEGVVDLDAPVVALLPGFTTADRDTARRTTVRQLLDHTSGLPEGLTLTDSFDEDRKIGDVVAGIAELQPVAEPGQTHSYSSLNYIVAAAVIEKVTGRSYGDMLEQQLLVPAGMGTVSADRAESERVLPPGHRYVLGQARPFKTRVDPATVPAGYLVGDLTDLAAFAQINLVGGPVLDDKQRQLLHTTEITTGEDSGYGLGWRTWHVPGSSEPMLWHGGAAPGYQSTILLLPERDLAVVVLQNAYGPFQENQLLDTAWGVASTIAGVTPEKHEVDPLYPVALLVLALLVFVLLVVTVRATWRIIRPAQENRSTKYLLIRLAITLICLTVVIAGLLALPRLFGIQLSQLGLWAPDLSWLVHGALIIAAGLAILRIAATLQKAPVKTVRKP